MAPLIGLMAAAAVQAHVQGQVFPMGLDPFGYSRIAPDETWTAQRARAVVLQRYDQGCGPAALATVLRYVYGDDATEAEILEEILRRRAEEGNLGGGVSFLDLIGAAESRGYETLAGAAPLGELKKLNVPAIVLLDRGELRHFVVVWGVVEDRVYMGDPLIGNMIVPLAEFEQEWLGVLLIVVPKEGQWQQAVAKVRDHLRFLDGTRWMQSSFSALESVYGSSLGTGLPFLAPLPGEF